MKFSFFRKSVPPDAVFGLYRSIVAQSRQPRFYADWGIPDTVTGRFDMISLHLTILLLRLKGDEAVRPFGQAVVNLFFRDMDRSLREMGVSDLGVPKRVKDMGNIFYGLVTALDGPLGRRDAVAVETVLRKNVFAAGAVGGPAELAAYLVAEADRVEREPTSAVLSPASREVAA